MAMEMGDKGEAKGTYYAVINILNFKTARWTIIIKASHHEDRFLLVVVIYNFTINLIITAT